LSTHQVAEQDGISASQPDQRIYCQLNLSLNETSIIQQNLCCTYVRSQAGMVMPVL